MTTPTRTEAGARAYALLSQAFSDPGLARQIAVQLGRMWRDEPDETARTEIGDAQGMALKLIPDDSLSSQLA